MCTLALAGCGGGSNSTNNDMAMGGPKDMAGGDLTMPGAMSYGFVSKTITLPMAPTDYAVDLNGDGKAENQLGNIVQGVSLAMIDLQAQEAASISAGTGLELFSFNTADSSFLNDPNATVDVYLAQPLANPKFDGTDVLNVDKSAPAGHVVGPLKTGAFVSTDPKTLTAPPVVYLSIPVYTNTTVNLPLQGAWLRFTPTSNGLTSGQLNGAVKKTDVDKILVPALAATFTTIAMTMPCDMSCMTVQSMFDIGGCTNPDGTMAVKGDNKIDICEVTSNVLLQSLLNPDVALFDSAGNWKPDPTNANKDCLSLGVAFDASVAKIIP
jgi:hypothetical protein